MQQGELGVQNNGALGTGTLTINGGQLMNGVAGISNKHNNVQTWNATFGYRGVSGRSLDLGAGAVTLGASLVVYASNGMLIVRGPIGDGGAGYGITKEGGNVLMLTGVSTYWGDTLVATGTLALADSGSIANSTSITVLTSAFLIVTGRVDKTLAVGASQTLSGDGTVRGVVTNEGVVAPGLTAGVLRVIGSYGQSGTLAIELGGLTPGVGGHDVLTVVSNGAVTLAGALEVTLINSFTPVLGNTFTVLTATALSGTFDTTNLPAVPSIGWTVDYAGNAVVLTAVEGGATPTPYEVWGADYGLSGADLYDQADPDNDGYANLLEYAQGSNPTSDTSSVKLRAVMTNGVARLFLQRVNSATDIVYHVEAAYAAGNGAAWSALSSNVLGVWDGAATVDDNNTGAVHEVRILDSVSAATNRFFRLRIERP